MPILLLDSHSRGLILALAALNATAGEGQVFVLYAGSLGNLMEKVARLEAGQVDAGIFYRNRILQRLSTMDTGHKRARATHV